MRGRAFTIVEVMIAVILLSIMAGVMTLSPSSVKQTARQEATKVAVKLRRLVETADRTHSGFWVDVEPDGLNIRIGADYKNPVTTSTFKVGKDFTLSSDREQFGYLTDSDTASGSRRVISKRDVSIITGTDPQDSSFSIQVTDEDSPPHYVRIIENQR